jgi:hypothetical protein
MKHGGPCSSEQRASSEYNVFGSNTTRSNPAKDSFLMSTLESVHNEERTLSEAMKRLNTRKPRPPTVISNNLLAMNAKTMLKVLPSS